MVFSISSIFDSRSLTFLYRSSYDSVSAFGFLAVFGFLDFDLDLVVDLVAI